MFISPVLSNIVTFFCTACTCYCLILYKWDNKISILLILSSFIYRQEIRPVIVQSFISFYRYCLLCRAWARKKLLELKNFGTKYNRGRTMKSLEAYRTITSIDLLVLNTVRCSIWYFKILKSVLYWLIGLHLIAADLNNKQIIYHNKYLLEWFIMNFYWR